MLIVLIFPVRTKTRTTRTTRTRTTEARTRPTKTGASRETDIHQVDLYGLELLNELGESILNEGVLGCRALGREGNKLRDQASSRPTIFFFNRLHLESLMDQLIPETGQTSLLYLVGNLRAESSQQNANLLGLIGQGNQTKELLEVEGHLTDTLTRTLPRFFNLCPPDALHLLRGKLFFEFSGEHVPGSNLGLVYSPPFGRHATEMGDSHQDGLLVGHPNTFLQTVHVQDPGE
ncbi:hypothetical protein PHYBLDRAFT_169332 [Phycomyces blakesleeanus NRRL 1555(-)]|uniref:Uncharacterized protein n=1 Tax=Phycomyces blakesleeanus (strain ATCC 8743b / DSM 1359 / FGSC 10004 / NBRC 33097 / NRRL 1555) TaxID=763407 RepID=A0A167MK52_PHYB8|nr:hypothetical protein PHYBLDRAFT_169332 [Phycomyces blakesleeanus NRRL 1555(-)]OAD73076.1 hypothetical protein PHYBLDRAFT_169332 [Phycomyces blakesleeanus NRRL 1555(-)]|eukprot:XP_018291116.1 hypothetical protein PHYBLDRAFT_169332 [Phycomyces blakesleeanus NRRL 1555(-)]